MKILHGDPVEEIRCEALGGGYDLIVARKGVTVRQAPPVSVN
jgi:hypothetical protein